MNRTILIVEDNVLNMKLLNDLLTAHGYRILKAVDGMEALTIAESNRPDLILMDVQLPGVSGIEVTKWLKQSEDTRHTPVIAVTAFAMDGDEERIRKCGCDEYISKPISIPTLLATIRRLLPQRPAASLKLVASTIAR